jgi:hypothetical protein
MFGATLTLRMFTARLTDSSGVYHLHQPFGYFRSAKCRMMNLIVESARVPTFENRPCGDGGRIGSKSALKTWVDRQS